MSERQAKALRSARAFIVWEKKLAIELSERMGGRVGFAPTLRRINRILKVIDTALGKRRK